MLFMLMLIGTVFEMLGIALVIPVLGIITQSDFMERYPVLASLFDRMGNPTHAELIIISMLLLVTVYAIRSSFLAFTGWKQMRFIFSLQAALSQRLFSLYLSQPYTFHLQRNSSQLIRNVMTEVHLFVMNLLIPGALLLTEVLVLMAVGALLFMVEPLGTSLVGGSVALMGWGFYRFTRKHIERWGKARQEHEGFKLLHLQQGLGGAKDVKLLGRESDFLAQYGYHANMVARVSQRHQTLQLMPRLWLEFLSVMGLTALVISIVIQGKPLDTILPTLGLFAAATFRLMPSMNRIITAMQSVRYGLPVIDTLHQDLTHLKQPAPAAVAAPMHFQGSLVFERVSYRYPNAAKAALSDVTLEIPRGSTVGFIGQSGAGKSTLVDILLGLLTPDSGAVKIDGTDIEQNLRGWQNQVGYVPQSIYLTDDTLRRNIAFGLPDDTIDEQAVMHALQAAQLDKFIRDLPNGLETIVGERGVRLSGGQRQRIGIARALYHDPSVLVLDEATSALDPRTEQDFMQAIQALHGKKTIIIVAHRLSTVEYCDKLYQLEDGMVIKQGTVRSILQNAGSE